jgi:hypothetical protein
VVGWAPQALSQPSLLGTVGMAGLSRKQLRVEAGTDRSRQMPQSVCSVAEWLDTQVT